jgi:hypothetical protein
MGYSCYFEFMCFATGNPFEGFQAQQFYPNHTSVANIFHLPPFFEAFFTSSELHGMTDSAIDRGLFLLLLPCLYFIFKLNMLLKYRDAALAGLFLLRSYPRLTPQATV